MDDRDARTSIERGRQPTVTGRDVGVALLAGAGGMLGWGFADFFAKKTIDRIGDVTTLFWAQLLGVAPILTLFAGHRVVPPMHRFDWPILIAFGIVGGLSYIPTYVAFGKGQVSVLSPIFASYSVLVALISALLFHESISTGTWIAIFIVLVGIAFVSSQPRDLLALFRGHATVTAGLREIALAVSIYSFWLVLLDRFMARRDWVMFILVIRCVAVISLYLYARATRISLVVKVHGLWPYLGIIGLFDVIAYSSVAYGFSHSTHTSIVAMLSSTFSLPTIVLARVFLKERMTRLQTGAVGLILGGVVLVSLR
jgi:drug/metabolite transporter (DMT)-like permease